MSGKDRMGESEPLGLDVNPKHVGLLLGLVFAVALAIVVAKQMSPEAMAVVIGVVCGVAAGIPTALLLLAVVGRWDRPMVQQMDRQARRGSFPPVVVIQGGTPQPLPLESQMGYWPAPMPGTSVKRQFHVVGGEDLTLDDRCY